MLDALASGAWKRPRAYLGAAAVLLALLALTASGLRDNLGHPDDSALAEPDLVVAVGNPDSVSGGVYDVALEAITAGIEARSDVEAVRSSKAPEGGTTTRLELDLGSANAAEARRIANSLESEVDPGPLEVSVSGRMARLLDAEEQAVDELWRVELLLVPLAGLLLAATLGPRAAAGPVLCAGIAVAGGLTGLGLAGGFTDLSLLGAVAVAGVGLGLGVELPSLLAARWQDEIRLDDPPTALRHTLGEGFGALCFAALCAGVGGGTIAAAYALGAFEPGLATAIGIALASGFALFGCLLVMPALLALDGLRAGGDGEPRGDRRMSTIAAWPSRVLARGPVRSALALALAIAACLALVYPALGLDSAPLAEVPRDSLGRSLPLVAGVGAGLLAVAFALRAGTLRAAPLGLAPVLVAAGALGTVEWLLGDDTHAAGAIGVGIAIVAAIAAARAASALDAVRSERELDPGPPGVAERAGELTVPAAALSTIVCGAAFAALERQDMAAAQELGVLVASGLVIDLLLRAPMLAALSRWGSRTAEGRSGLPGRVRVGWPRWRRRAKTEAGTGSPS